MLHPLQQVQKILHYVYPLLVFIYFAITSTVVVCALHRPSAKTSPQRFKVIWSALLLFIATYGFQAGSKVVEIILTEHWPPQSTIIGLLACILVFGVQQNSIGDLSNIVWYPYYGSWLLASLFEPVMAVISLTLAHNSYGDGQDTFLGWEPPLFVQLDASFSLIRFAIVLGVLVVYFSSHVPDTADASDEERAPLIPKPDQASNNGNGSTDSGYGTSSEVANTESTNTETTTSPTDPESPWERHQRELREKMEKRLKDEGSWIAYVKGFTLFIPYVWPVNRPRLQFHVVLVGLCILAGNGLNFLIPRQLGAVLDSLGGASDKSPWFQVGIFAVLRFLDSEAGIPLIRYLLWMPVDYYSQEALSIAAYSHVMNLSSDFHDAQSSSDLQVAISNGYHISNLLESVCFQAVPMIIDLVVAFSYLSYKFGPYEGFITMATGLAFIQAAAQLIARFKEKRKKLVSTYFEEHYTRQAGIQGWYTVSAFNQVPYEESRYSKAIKTQISTAKSIYTGYLIGQAFQYLILLAGLLAGAFLAVYQITNKQATPGDFGMLLAYWGQLTSPLRFFSNMGRNISQSFVQVERLLEVMLTKPTVVDKPNAQPLKLKGGKVEFKNVSFSYDKKKDILKGVELSVSPGITVAFVGATGAGKSTIFKVLDRFYDVASGGQILIDGQNIKDVTLSSLRDCIGIVPQSPILFDDTIMNNVRYARLNASDEDVYSACKAAAIHDQIMGFTEGYSTRVGERGVKLSGGELQRVAIARAILKNPEIVLLDEATSAVDTDTEQKIQMGLEALCKNRTTFIVAHRLSTVMNADVIFVVANGQVVEQGSHEELIAMNGKYAELWSKQIFVKAKDQEEGSETSKGSSSAAEPVETPPSESTSEAREPELKDASTNTAGVDGADGADGAYDQPEPVAQTPLVHKKESSKLNPGAPEFTPRTVKVISVCPMRSTWAEDVEEDATSSRQVVDQNIDSKCVNEVTEQVPTKQEPAVAASEALTESTAKNSPEVRPRRNTLQSISCPDQLSLQSSPTRSVSQPVPRQPIPTSSATPDKATPPTDQPSFQTTPPEEIVKETPAVAGIRPRSGPGRGQSTSRGRGRGYRGRYRGRGRRAGPAATNSNQRTGLSTATSNQK